MSLRYQMIRSSAELTRLRPAWKELEAAAAQPLQLFQNPVWVETWWKHFGNRHRLRILAGWRGQELAMVWPMIETRHGLGASLAPVGGLLSCFADAVIEDDPAMEDWLAGAWTTFGAESGANGISLPAVHEHARIAGAVARCGGEPIQETSSPCIDASAFGSLDGYLKDRSKRFRKELRRSWRDLSALGSTESLINDPRLTPTTSIETILKFKRDWVRVRGLNGKTVLSQRGEEFLKDVCEEFSRHDHGVDLRISSLRLDDEVIAAGLAFGYRGEQYEYLGGFDYSHYRTGVGKVQLAESIGYSIESRDRVCNLLTPGTEFKRRWTDDSPKVRQYFAAMAWHSKLYREVYLRTARPVMKQIYRATIPKLKRRDFHGDA